jgi:hypothetical protein
LIRNHLFLTIIALSLFSCEKSDKSPSALGLAKATNSVEAEKEKSIDELWNALLFQESSCLIGSGYYKENGIPDEYGSVTFKNKSWKTLQTKNEKTLTEFLLNKLSDTLLTKVHNCPNLNATQGEMSVYALQQLHQKNWWDFEEFAEYKDKTTRDVNDHPQIWLQNLLSYTKQRQQLADLYRKELDL